MNLLNRLKTGWTLLKLIRVALGVLILYSSVQQGQVTGMILGGIFTLFALFTDGVCCSGSSCYIPEKNKTQQPPKDAGYEELDSK